MSIVVGHRLRGFRALRRSLIIQLFAALTSGPMGEFGFHLEHRDGRERVGGVLLATQHWKPKVGNQAMRRFVQQHEEHVAGLRTRSSP